MATAIVTTWSGASIEVEVTDEVYAVLAHDPDSEPAPEVLFSTMERRPAGAADAPDLASIEWLSHELRLYYRGLKSRADISSWEGPRYEFTLILGSNLHWIAPWDGKGPCPACHGLPLPPIGCCLVCDRTGRDLDIPPVPRELWRHCARVERERRAGQGDGPALKGGKGR